MNDPLDFDPGFLKIFACVLAAGVAVIFAINRKPKRSSIAMTRRRSWGPRGNTDNASAPVVDAGSGWTGATFLSSKSFSVRRNEPSPQGRMGHQRRG